MPAREKKNNKKNQGDRAAKREKERKKSVIVESLITAYDFMEILP